MIERSLVSGRALITDPGTRPTPQRALRLRAPALEFVDPDLYRCVASEDQHGVLERIALRILEVI